MKTTDVWFASYLKIKGYKIVNFEIISRGKGRFIFEISKEDWKSNKIEFLNSNISKIKQTMQELKDLLY